MLDKIVSMTKEEQIRIMTAVLCSTDIFRSVDPDALMKKAKKKAEKIYELVKEENE